MTETVEPISDEDFREILSASEDMANHDQRKFMGYSLKSIVAHVRAQDVEIERLRRALTRPFRPNRKMNK